jgi:hypothetical protein
MGNICQPFLSWEMQAPHQVCVLVRVTPKEGRAILKVWIARLQNIRSEKPFEVGDG